MDRKEFIGVLARIGAGTCMCAAVGGMRAALGAEASPPKPTGSVADSTRSIDRTKPGDKTIERAAKRMEFADAWVQRFFAELDRTVDEPTRRKLMEANGRACLIAYAGPPRRPPTTLERFTRWAGEHGQASGYSVAGNVITFEYVGSAETGQPSPEGVCLCPTAEAQSAATMSPTYCWCSAGYVRELHERIFGRPVNVELTQAVLMGHPRCRFRITLA
jgi:hypothetical protein